MSSRLALVSMALLCALGLASSCRFEPDLSRFEPCAEDGSCPEGFTCLAEAQRCLPDCGDEAPCSPEFPPDASTDAGVPEDGGVDAGMDAGTDAGTDAGPPLSLVTKTLPRAVEKSPYAVELLAQGGTPPYEFRATEPLPEGLTLDAGILSGAISMPDRYDVAVEVLDSDTPPARAATTYGLQVRPQLRVAGPRPLMDAYSGNFYSENVSAIGGVPPYRFSLDGGSLPSGLSFQNDGSVKGTPSGSGTYGINVEVTDSDPQQPQTAVRDLSLSLTGTPLGMTIANKSVPDGRVGTPYQYTLRVSSSGTVSWSLKAGTLPNGVGLSTTTGVISGTPNEANSFTFTIRVTDGLLGSDEKTFTMKVF